MVKINNEDFDIEKISDCGHSFRLNKNGDVWELVALNKVLRIYNDNELDCTDKEFEEIWAPYFDMDTDYSVFRAAVPESDEFLTAAAEYGKGIRILRQDPFEMLITFITSQQKGIPAIKSTIEAMCRRFGEELELGYYDFPTPEALAQATDEELKACSLGFRVPYIMSAAKMVATGDLDLYGLYDLSNEDLYNELIRVHGVGAKVANCVRLFAYHRTDAFPIDVWIKRVLEKKYDNNFPFELYKGFAGVMQQYIFYYARKSKEFK